MSSKSSSYSREVRLIDCLNREVSSQYSSSLSVKELLAKGKQNHVITLGCKFSISENIVSKANIVLFLLLISAIFAKVKAMLKYNLVLSYNPSIFILSLSTSLLSKTVFIQNPPCYSKHF